MPPDRLAVLTARIDKYSTALRLEGTAGTTFARVTGPVLKAEVATAAAAAFGADLKPFKGKSVKAGFGYDLEPTGTGTKLVFKLRPAGIWAFGEHGAGPHLIGIKRVGRGRKIKTGFIHGGGYAHPVRGPVLHPGTPGVGAIRYAFKLVRGTQLKAVAAGITAVVEQVTRGR